MMSDIGGSSYLLRFCIFIIACVQQKVKYFDEKFKKIFF